MIDKIKKYCKSHKNLVICMAFVLVVAVAGGCYYGYQKYQKEKPVELAISEVIILSKMDVFPGVEINDNNILTLKVGEYIERTVIDVDGEEKIITKDSIVKSDAGFLDMKELIDMGMSIKSFKQVSGGDNWLLDRILLNLALLLVAVLLVFLVYKYDLLSGVAHKQFKKSKGSITFSDIGGLQGIKGELLEVIGFLHDKDKLLSMGANIPRGILLAGAPGTGKTMLARAIAQEVDVPFLYATASDFHSMYVSSAAQRVKKLFKEARKQPCVVFIDEFDSIAQKRIYGGDAVSTEFGHTLTQLLSEMDGMDVNAGVIVVAATNHPEALDEAVLRTGRFDRKIVINLPTYLERCEIIEIHAKNKKLDDSFSVEKIARQTSGFSGSDLAAVINEAAIIAGMNGKDSITMEDIDKAIDKTLAGGERKGIDISWDEKMRIAFHEAGHALVASMLSDCDKVQRITILPHGQAGGFTRTAPDSDITLISKSKAMARVSMLLGGRAAEEVCCGEVSSGAQNDLRQANIIASEMVKHYGMGERFGIKYCQDNSGFSPFAISISNESAKEIDSDIADILQECYKKASDTIIENDKVFRLIVNRLLEEEVLSRESIDKIIADGQ